MASVSLESVFVVHTARRIFPPGLVTAHRTAGRVLFDGADLTRLTGRKWQACTGWVVLR
jgi:hypothetical protein